MTEELLMPDGIEVVPTTPAEVLATLATLTPRLAGDRRDRFIAALRAAADMLEGNPRLPVPHAANIQIDSNVFGRDLPYAEQRARVDEVAAELGAQTTDNGGYYRAEVEHGQWSGAVRYYAVAIPPETGEPTP